MTHERNVIAQHEREIQNILFVPVLQNFKIGRSCRIRFQFWIYSRRDGEMQVPHKAEDKECAHAGNTCKLENLLPVWKECIHNRKSKENDDEPDQFGRKTRRKGSSKEDGPSDECVSLISVF